MKSSSSSFLNDHSEQVPNQSGTKENDESKSDNNNNNNQNANVLLVDEYLHRILAVAQLLAQKPTKQPPADDAVMHDAAPTAAAPRLGNSVDPIARLLLLASRPDVLASSTRNLPPLALKLPGVSADDDDDDDEMDVLDLNEYDQDDDDDDDMEHDDDDDNNRSRHRVVVPSYHLARVDHLRQFLRAMAPIQLDVAAHVATILQDHHHHRHHQNLSSSKSKQQKQNDDSTVDDKNVKHQDDDDDDEWTTLSAAAVILFSIWLPVAPQITPIVSSLLALPNGVLTCPLRQLHHNHLHGNNRQRLIVMRACHELVDYYYQIQNDYPFIISWGWDWTPVFACLNNNNNNASKLDNVNTDMNDDDNNNNNFSSYNIQEAIHWHAVRTAASLLDLKPAAKAEYVQRYSGGGHNAQPHHSLELVPWVLHPWAKNQQEYVAQRLSFLGRAQIWQQQQQNYHNNNDDDDDDNDANDNDNNNHDNGNDYSFACPTALQIRNVVPLHPYLVDCGRGIVLVKRNVIVHDEPQQEQDVEMDKLGGNNKLNDIDADDDDHNTNNGRCPLIRTATTVHNLSLLAANLCIQPFPPPILLCGPGGSGKSSLVRELARLLSAKSTTRGCRSRGYHHDDDLLEIHVDEEMDTKTLVGSYTTTDIPGEFSWRPGALTIAVRLGKWVLIEDLPLVPIEIQASLVQLLKDRLLPLGNGKVEPCHANFRLFATMTTTTSSGGGASPSSFAGKRLLHPDLWAHVHVKPLPFVELQEISQGLYPRIPDFIVQTVFGIFKVLDESGRQEQQQGHGNDAIMNETNIVSTASPPLSLVRRLKMGGRTPSVRDLFKVLSRISHGVVFEQQQHQQRFALESQRMICLQNVFDIFAAACADDETRRDFMLTLAAPAFNLTSDLALAHYQTRRPTLVQHESCTEIGRARIHVSASNLESSLSSSSSNNGSFAATGSALRLMESIGLCISENEPVLLVGETGGGKTTILQQLARLCGRELIVQNLSLQTDSTDLLGGYRPLEIRHIARLVYQDFVDLFVGTFSRKQNADFLTFTASAQAKGQWKKLSQCFRRAATLGLAKVQDNNDNKSRVAWQRFSETAAKFEQQRIACDSGLAFVFSEGALVDAIRKGKWVLLDEINLASSETLQRLCGLLDDATSSITLTERGDAVAVERHPDFRLFGAMNPATDSGKKDLSSSVRSRFTELYIDELLDPVELRAVAGRYLSSVLPAVGDLPPDHQGTVITVVDLYLQCRHLANFSLVDGGGHRPRYTLRTLSRALTAARTFVTEQRVGLNRALYEGFELAFQGPLEAKSLQSIKKVIYPALGQGLKSKEMDHPGRRPGNQSQADNYVLIKPFWIRRGPLQPIDWSEESSSQAGGRFAKFVLTPSTAINVRRLARAIASGPWPILLEGATSTGKTTLVEYVAARCGHKVIRINNHEHTDVQEYTGGFAADSNGSLSFRDGLLVQALRNGHWVILDELNLAPSEVLEALNRLLDDNRELYLAEVNETVKPHADFRLFATQNPSGAYGGRKPLSRAFRNRFVELHISDIPSAEMVTILEQRCGCPPSHAKILVAVMNELRQRRSTSGLFLGKDGYITPRDLLRWAERKAGSKLELAEEGYMLLAERLRTEEEKKFVQAEIEKQFKLKIKPESMYYDPSSQAMQIIQKAVSLDSKHSLLSSIAPTRSLLRLLALVLRCMAQKEPVLLVGETGCGKTTAVQLLSYVFSTPLHTINCHATTETSDILGGLRPVRGRALIECELLEKTRMFYSQWPDGEAKRSISVPEFLTTEIQDDRMDSEQTGGQLSTDAIITMVTFARNLWALRPGAGGSPERKAKRQKTVVIDSNGTDADFHRETLSSLAALMGDIEELSRRYNSLFEWADGPLVRAMKEGHMILLDEMSLAEDAVLERLNSVLEPSRTLVLAEKGAAEGESDSAVVVAADQFLLFATMNPGGDFGKRELSPALRSRFTEIWVPPVTDQDDVKLVVEHALSSGVFHNRSVERSKLVELMMAYVEWFNGDICSDPTGPCSELTLSLRDILTWARFIVIALERNADIGLWDAYFQGACLMHLDGLGLGTSLAKNDATTTRKRAESFLLRQIQPFGSLPKINNGRFQVVDGRFGTGSFWIETGTHPIRPDAAFNLEAPTTATNIFRVLRAMQLSKPVLLEGSPGVGKSSLVAALAAACGHNLVRINLSEQTDMSDLLGSDLPVPEASNGTSGAAFKWCDGVLLSAIKTGAWVLLDELNLASQSVLEGLNSCLDHRASIFIPELGRSFDCPPTFRVFSAQNPLGQGGGRKGLPKSFLNRFTKVYVEALCDIDLRSIVCTKFSTLPTTLLDSIVSFNSCLHRETCELQSFGHNGSPWEFNLRDVFRWCELLSTTTTPDDPTVSARFVRDLYQLRFRTLNDREALASKFVEAFKTDLSQEPLMLATSSSQNSIQIGTVLLKRARLDIDPRQGAAPLGEASLVSLLEPMEAVARCIERKWPCLLVGEASSGKSSVIRTVAQLSNATLVEIALSPSSDVSELVGTFEQTDKRQNVVEKILCLVQIATKCLARDKSPKTDEIACLCLDLSQSPAPTADLKCFVNKALNLIDILLHNTEVAGSKEKACDNEIEGIHQFLSEWTSQEAASGDRRGLGHFEWKDGVLVRAMRHGHWLHLKNANLCPSSVLDRLNPVLEPSGYLLLAECGVDTDAAEESDHGVIRCHPNFRVFLSMNPEHGEVSRAMRNRCVEISFLAAAQPESEKSHVDWTDCTWKAGLRSSILASSLLRLGSDHKFSRRTLKNTAAMVSCLIARGTATSSLALGCDGFYDESSSSCLGEKLACAISEKMPSVSSFRLDWPYDPVLARSSWDARPLELAMGGTIAVSYHKASGGQSVVLRNHLLSLFIEKCDVRDLSARMKFLDTLDEPVALSFRFMTRSVETIFPTLSQPTCERRIALRDACEPSQLIAIRRTAQSLREKVWEDARRRNDKKTPPSVLETSFALHEGSLDRTSVDCPVTPSLYPFFRALDRWMNSLLESLHAEKNLDQEKEEAFEALFCNRDLLWNVLQAASTGEGNGLVGFQEIEFVVQWTRLKMALQKFEKLFNSIQSSQAKRTVDVLVDVMDQVVFGQTGSHESSSLWRKVPAPFVPRQASCWEAMFELRELGQSCSLSKIESSQDGTINLASLVAEKHAVLIAGVDLKRQILALLSMLHISSIEHAWPGFGVLQDIQPIVDNVLRAQFVKARSSFAHRLNLVRIDSKIKTVPNSMHVEALGDVMLKAGAVWEGYNELCHELLLKFASIQISPCTEFWCEQQESAIISDVCKMLIMERRDGAAINLATLAPRCRALIEVGLTSQWTVSDLSPFQTLLWAAEGGLVETAAKRKLLQGALSALSLISSQRAWNYASNRFKDFSLRLELPVLIDSVAYEVDHKYHRGEAKTSPSDVPGATIFSLVGQDISLRSVHTPGSAFSTVENFHVRHEQAKKLLEFLASRVKNNERSKPWEILYFFVQILEGLRDSFESEAYHRLISFLHLSKFQDDTLVNDFLEIAATGCNKVFHGLLQSIVRPLLLCLNRLWSGPRGERECHADHGLGQIYLGLLRFHLLLPDSPLDPGRKPVAKVSLIDRQLAEMRSRVAAERFHEGMTTGNFDPDNSHIRDLLGADKALALIRTRQEKKIIERAQGAPPFVSLYREVKEVASAGFLGMDEVLELVRRIQRNGNSVAEQRVEHWQSTLQAFCYRILHKFAAYEDIIAPLVHAASMMSIGVRSLASITGKRGGLDLTRTMQSSLQFPVSYTTAVINSDIEAGVIANSQNSKDSQHCARMIAFSCLARLVLTLKLSRESDASILNSWSQALALLLNCVEVSPFEGDPPPTTDDEKWEQQFRAQFPDHRQEFKFVIQNEEEREEDDDQETPPEKTQMSSTLSEVEVQQLCWLHDRAFGSAGGPDVSDFDRVVAFKRGYNVASNIHEADFYDPLTYVPEKAAAGHAMALSIVAPGSLGYHCIAIVGQIQRNFYKDPDPSETRKAAEPLGRLIARIAQLLSAFPGNDILLPICKLAERVRKLDILTLPVGKLLAGLELILKNAQDWEQHASDRVRIGKPLEEISALVTCFRKLELKSWALLLDSREEEYAKRGRRHWMHLNKALQEVVGDKIMKTTGPCDAPSDASHFPPRWVWKSISSRISGSGFTQPWPHSPEDISELLKTLDTFILTSPLGELRARLDMLKSFSSQLNHDAAFNEQAFPGARSLSSLCNYYGQFSEALFAMLGKLRQPYEARLKDEVKLAKWDEQSYYALAESTERNHRKLMKIIREYDEVLDMNVGQLLERELERGVGSEKGSEEGSPSIPSKSLFFSLCTTVMSETSDLCPHLTVPALKERLWTNISSLVETSQDSLIGRLAVYSTKVESFLKSEASRNSPSLIGNTLAAEICDAVFDRIESLRSDKTTRPMKERALVDLFRELKQHGYQSTKWSAPPELRRMGDIFQIPTPLLNSFDGDGKPLDSSEKYYQRCLSEIGRLRAEVLTLGSKHLTKRQIDMMLGLSEHGLLLDLQQRSMISHVLSQRSVLASAIKALSQTDSRLPPGQMMPRKRFLEFEKLYASSIESIRQLRLLVMSARPLMNGSAKENWNRDTVAKISDFLLSSRTPTTCLLVTSLHVDEMEKKKQHLLAGSAIVKSCVLDSSGQSCVPSSSFWTCIKQIEEAARVAGQCCETANRSTKDEKEAVREFVSLSSRAVESSLLAAQTWMKSPHQEAESQGIWDCHREATCEMATLNIKRLQEHSSAVLESLQALQETHIVGQEKLSVCIALASDLAQLYSQVLVLIDRRLKEYIAFYRSTSKLHYVLLRVFRVLVAKGFCSTKTAEEGEDQADGDAAGMTFEDEKEGTGMGEGEGARDVTDELESEEQLLGLKNDENDKKADSQEQGQKLEKEEAEKGMEMEADFEGEMHDLPDDPADEQGSEQEDEEEELDREMGEEGGENEEVLDEKLWNEEDDEDDEGGDQKEEKLEKNSSVHGDGTTDEMITQESEKDEKNKQDQKETDPSPDTTDEQPPTAETEPEEKINEDKEDGYEDSHGVDVRDERTPEEEKENAMDEVSDEMNLDDEEKQDGNEGDDDNEGDVQDDDMEHPPENEEGKPGDIDAIQDESGQESETEPAPDEFPGNSQDAMIEEHSENEDEPSQDDAEAPQVNKREQSDPQRGLGVRAQDGQDAVEDETPMEQEAESGQHEADEEPNKEENNAADDTMDDERAQGGNSNSNNASKQGQAVGDASGAESESTPAKEMPNPFRNPGDVTKFWHRKLNIIQSNQEPPQDPMDKHSQEPTVDDGSQEKDGDFEYIGEQQEGTTQALGEVDDHETPPQMNEEAFEEGDIACEEEAPQKRNTGEDTHESPTQPESKQRSRSKKVGASLDNNMDVDGEEAEVEDEEELKDDTTSNDEVQDDKVDLESGNSSDEHELPTGNQIVADLSRLNVEDGSIDRGSANRVITEDDLQQTAGISTAQHEAARARWTRIQSETYGLSRRLCEKLRLVMEPLVASKLRGDYRTGKRINMKRVIGYIASGYRKDKIWLRRTKPAKRNYRVLLAVDDSESMLKTGAGEMALKAMATLATGMSQLEIGEVGIASFGSEMNLLHPFGQAFTSESGVNVTQQLSFNQQRTRTALCVESALMALEEAESGGGCDFSSMQLVFLISDGRIERDSRATLRRLLREMMERNILMAMIIVEGGTAGDDKKESIVNMKEVTFEKGKPRVKPFMEDYPFPYYIVLDDMRSLPEVLGDALRQWFEMLTRLQTGSR